MVYNINLLKNKFRRLKIEVHHNRNKTSHRDPIIQDRDPTKPFITLRTSEPRPRWDFEVEPTVREGDLNEFGGFSDISRNGYQQDDEETEEYHERHQTLLESTIKSYLSSHRRHKSRAPSQAGSQLEHSCECTCHANVQEYKSPVYHNPSCLQICEVSETNDAEVLPKITKSVSKINYIEPKPARRGFWIFKRRHPLSKIPDPEPEAEPEAEDNNDEYISDQNTVTSAVRRIEIIAQSTAGVESPVENEQDTLKTLSQKIKESTSFKRHSKSKPSLVNFSRPNSQVVYENGGSISPISRHDRVSEPWRHIMNDISLHAALLSTGSKPKLSRSTINLGADFTSSKHDPNLRPISNNSYLAELISFGSVKGQYNNVAPKDDYHSYPEENYKENTMPKSIWNENITDQTLLPINKQDEYLNPDTRPSTKKSKFSVVSEPLEQDYLQGAETSAVYGGVFQDYNYSDESTEGWKSHRASKQQLLNRNVSEPPEFNDSNSEILPLNISSKGLTRIF